MIKIYLLLLFSLVLPLTHTKIYHVVSMISEGARYHINDLYDGVLTKDRWGELTPVGLRQQETLGKLFKKEYGDKAGLLSSAFVKDELVYYTTTYNSTIESALTNLYGMYPLGNGQKLEPA
jgi:hypothetical protein